MAVRSVWHWGPLVALTIIVSLFSSTLYILWYGYPTLSWPMRLNAGVWALLVVLVLLNFFKAIYTGPGSVPAGWKPEKKEDEASLQYCSVCKAFKAPRAHHCHQCNQCSKKMDHHCPWINSCVGNDNHFYFVAFVSAVPVGCLQTCHMMAYYLWYYWPAAEYDPVQDQMVVPPEQLLRSVIALFSCGLSLGVAIAVGVLCVVQLRVLWKNMTDIEAWIMEKAACREGNERFVYPYNLGLRRNLQEAYSHWKRRDGIHWAVAPGCSVYTLSIEQLKQKELKKKASELCLVDRPSGRCCGARHGIRVMLDSPCLDGHLLSVKEGDYMFITAGTKHWAYGELGGVVEGEFVAAVPRRRGWVPRAVLVKKKKKAE